MSESNRPRCTPRYSRIKPTIVVGEVSVELFSLSENGVHRVRTGPMSPSLFSQPRFAMKDRPESNVDGQRAASTVAALPLKLTGWTGS